MRRINSVLSLAVALVMTASIFSIGISAKAGDIDFWDGTADTAWYDPTQTEFTISTAEQLAGMAVLTDMGITFSGCSFKLVTDIKINTGDSSIWEDIAPANRWKPIGGTVTSFAGNFDGQGHTISGLYFPLPIDETGASWWYRGLFGSIGDASGMSSVTVENIVLTNNYIGAYAVAAPLAAQALGSVTVKNIAVSSSKVVVPVDWYTTKKSSQAHAAGVIGKTSGVTELAVDSVSVTDSHIEGWVRVGSIIGGGTGIYASISNCYSDSYIKAGNRPGGIIGHSSISLIEMSGCVFDGTIDCTETPNYGAMIGGFRADTTAEILITDCFYAGSYLLCGKPSTARVASTEIGRMADGSVYYSASADDSSARPSGNDTDGCEVAPKIKGDGAFAAAAVRLDPSKWDISDGKATLKPVELREISFEGYPEAGSTDKTTARVPETTRSPETTIAPETTAEAPIENGCGAMVDGIAVLAILGTAWITKKR